MTDKIDLKRDKQTIDLLMKAMEDIKANNPVCLDLRDMTDIADYMLVVSGNSSRHIKGIYERILEVAKKNKIEFLGSEGLDTKEWVLMDLNSIIIHIMSDEQRKLYQLESLWSVPPVI